MKLRELLKWFNDALRPPHVAGAQEGKRPKAEDIAIGTNTAPVDWVPSQQDSGSTHDGGVL